ncbi:MAG: hypothetical protein CME06_12395 [Gemmatimonadetes bacterium]|nr:hypothetical protein [Gemmatimonadota bacterium]
MESPRRSPLPFVERIACSTLLIAAAALLMPASAPAGFLGELQAEIQEILDSNPGSVVKVVSSYRAPADGAEQTPVRVVSGVVWDAHHVVTFDPALGRASWIEIRAEGMEARQASLLGQDPISRLSVLQSTKELAAPLPRRHVPARNAEVILILGNPTGDRPSAKIGLVGGGVPRGLDLGPSEWMHITAPIGPGDAGGAVLDIAGKLIGIVAGALPETGPGDLSVAVSIARARRGLERLIAKGAQGEYGYLGVTAEECSDPLPCVQVTDVVPRGPAFEAGLMPGDRILKVNGVTVPSVDALLESVVYSPIGTALRVSASRGGSPLDVDVVIRRRTVGFDRSVDWAIAQEGMGAAEKKNLSPSHVSSPPTKALELFEAKFETLESEVDQLRFELERCTGSIPH